MKPLEERLGEWYPILENVLKGPEMMNVRQKLGKVPASILCPRPHEVFRAFELCQPKDVKVVIIGQDPYFTAGIADGLCFSMRTGGNTPSFRNIRTAVTQSGYSLTNSDLTPWAEQGVLMLNTVLTTIIGTANAHKLWGWQALTGKVINVLTDLPQFKVWMLWGKQAMETYLQYKSYANSNTVLHCSHPAARGFYNDFIQSNHFTKCNNILIEKGYTPINWTT